MFVGKVIGNVVATVKDPQLEGVKFLVVQLLDDDGNPLGDPIVAADAIRVSGEGDLVYLAMKREAAIALKPDNYGPIDAAITGFIDEYHVVDEAEKYQAPKKAPATPKPKSSSSTPRKKTRTKPQSKPTTEPEISPTQPKEE